MDFGLMFFSSAHNTTSNSAYRMLTEAAKFADERGFCCIWTPERHFHEFGGFFPNPAVTSAALAMITKRIQLRAGSLISPLHDLIRIVEEWAVVDHLSGGRVAISFGSGWNVDDFVLAPDIYTKRQAIMYEQMEEIRRLWARGSLTRANGVGKLIDVKTYPAPFQAQLPVWVTSSGNPDTFVKAGKVGANLLTHLLGQDVQALASKIQLYREALAKSGFDRKEHKVSLMLHAFVWEDVDFALDAVRIPLSDYLRSAVSLERKSADGGGAISGGHRIASDEISNTDMDDLLDAAVRRYCEGAALIGTPDSCSELVWRLKSIGVDEIACLLDFGVDESLVLQGLEYLDRLRAQFSPESLRDLEDSLVDRFLETVVGT